MGTASFSLVKFLEGTVSAESYPGPSFSYLRTSDGRKHRYLAVLEQDEVSRDEVQRQEPSWREVSGRAIDERDIHRGGEREERDEWLEQCFAVLARHPDASALCHSLARPRAAHSALDASMDSTDIGSSGPPRSHFSSRALHATIQDSNGFATFQTPSSWIHLGLAFACVMAAAIASGLTIGLMSIEPLELEIKERIGTVEERSQAHRLLPLLNRRHLLLVTLLLFNAAAAEALPLFLDALVPSYVAVILSVTAVLFFGEIFPSAVFLGPNQLKLGSRMTPVVWCLICFFFPIACPIAWCLDRFLGDEHGHGKRYSREELSALMEIHLKQRRGGKNGDKADEAQATPGATPSLVPSSSLALAPAGKRTPALLSLHTASFPPSALASHALLANASPLSPPEVRLEEDAQEGVKKGRRTKKGKKHNQGQSSHSPGPVPPAAGAFAPPAPHSTLLSKREVDIVVGVLQISNKVVADCMVPWTSVCCLAVDAPLNEETLKAIRAAGFSRLPVCFRQGGGKEGREGGRRGSSGGEMNGTREGARASGREWREGRRGEGWVGKREAASVCGYVLTKSLIEVDPHAGLTVGAMKKRLVRCPIVVAPSCPLIDILSTFQLGHAHLALVSEAPEETLACLLGKGEGEGGLTPERIAPVGIITLEDVMEMMLQTEIWDETDVRERTDSVLTAEEEEEEKEMSVVPTEGRREEAQGASRSMRSFSLRAHRKEPGDGPGREGGQDEGRGGSPFSVGRHASKYAHSPALFPSIAHNQDGSPVSTNVSSMTSSQSQLSLARGLSSNKSVIISSAMMGRYPSLPLSTPAASATARALAAAAAAAASEEAPRRPSPSLGGDATVDTSLLPISFVSSTSTSSSTASSNTVYNWLRLRHAVKRYSRAQLEQLMLDVEEEAEREREVEGTTKGTMTRDGGPVEEEEEGPEEDGWEREEAGRARKAGAEEGAGDERVVQLQKLSTVLHRSFRGGSLRVIREGRKEGEDVHAGAIAIPPDVQEANPELVEELMKE